LNLIKGEGVFILSEKEKKSLINEDIAVANYIKPIYKNSDLKKWKIVKKSNLHITYIKEEGVPIALPNVLKLHFEKFRTILTDKKENCFKNPWLKKIVEPWLTRGNYFVLFYPREKEYFEQPKIVNSRRAKLNVFAYEPNGYFEQSDIVIANLKSSSPVSLKFLICLLNSKLYYLWLYNKGKRKGDQLELFQKPLKEIPIKFSKNIKIYEDLFDEIYNSKNLSSNISDIEKQLDVMVYRLFNLTFSEVLVVDPNFSFNQKEYESNNEF
jgi:adenine-specific DNA-methyltransferase